MSINLVQFQQGLSMIEFMQEYGTEAKAYRALYKSRWPHGFRCPACGDRRRSRFLRSRQVYYQCRPCRHQTTLLSGTIPWGLPLVVFEATKLPLRTWLLSIHLLTATKTTNGSLQGTNMAALELMRHLGVNYDQRESPRDKAAWRIKHKVMQAMAEREAPRQLSGFVQIDDAYLGGERDGGKPGRGSENKQAFLIAVQTDAKLEHPTCAVIEPVRSIDNAGFKDWQKRHLEPDAEVFSDGLFCFRRFADARHAHTVLETGGGRAACEVNGARWVNVLLSNVERAISGSYDQRKSPRDHAIRQGKYARLYLAEAAYRFSRRFDLRAMLPRLARAMMLCKPHLEPVLRMACNFHG